MSRTPMLSRVMASRPSPEVVLFLALLFGTVAFSRDFAYLRVTLGGVPLYVTEAGLGVLGVLVLWRRARGGTWRELRSPLDLWMAPWVAVGLVELIRGLPVDALRSFRDFAIVYYAAFFYLARSIFTTAARVRWLMGVFLAGTLVRIGLTTVDYVLGVDLLEGVHMAPVEFAAHNLRIGRYMAGYDGLYLVAASLGVAALWRTRSRKPVLFLYLCFAGFSLMLAQQRSLLMVAVLGWGVLWALSRWGSLPRPAPVIAWCLGSLLLWGGLTTAANWGFDTEQGKKKSARDGAGLPPRAVQGALTSDAKEAQGYRSAPGSGSTVAPVDTATASQVTVQKGPPRQVPRGDDINIRQWKQLLYPNSPIVPADPSLRADPAVRAAATAAPPLQPNFQGIPYTGFSPPSAHIAAGVGHLVAVVNTSWTVFDKTGRSLFQTTLESWFANVLPSGGSDFIVFGPRVIWDPHLERFIIVAAAVNFSTRQAFWVLSLSPIGSATGGWCNIATDAILNGNNPTINWNDYPRIGVDTRGIYLTGNMFSFSGPFQYAKLRVLSKAQISAVLFGGCSGSFNYVDFWDLKNPSDNSLAFTVNPALSYGEPAVEYLVNSRSGSGSTITLWRVAGAHLIPASGPTLWRNEVPVSAYSLPPDGVQPGGARMIDTGDARLLGAVLTAGGVWTAHTVSCDLGGGPVESCLRVYLIDPAFSKQQFVATFGAQDLFYFYPEIAADPFGNATVVFSRSGATLFAEVRFTRRRVGAGALEASALLKPGASTYLQADSFGRNRWGDHLGAALDPSHPDTIWFIGGFAALSNTWGTWIGAAKYYDEARRISREQVRGEKIREILGPDQRKTHDAPVVAQEGASRTSPAGQESSAEARRLDLELWRKFLAPVGYSTSQFRWDAWREAARRFVENPILGEGFGRPFIFYAKSSGRWIVEDVRPHNTYLTILWKMGIVGLAVFAGLHLAFFRWVIRLWRAAREPGVRLRAAGFGAALLALQAYGGLNLLLESPYTALVYWSLMGIIVASLEQASAHDEG